MSSSHSSSSHHSLTQSSDPSSGTSSTDGGGRGGGGGGGGGEGGADRSVSVSSSFPQSSASDCITTSTPQEGDGEGGGEGGEGEDIKREERGEELHNVSSLSVGYGRDCEDSEEGRGGGSEEGGTERQADKAVVEKRELTVCGEEESQEVVTAAAEEDEDSDATVVDGETVRATPDENHEKIAQDRHSSSSSLSEPWRLVCSSNSNTHTQSSSGTTSSEVTSVHPQPQLQQRSPLPLLTESQLSDSVPDSEPPLVIDVPDSQCSQLQCSGGSNSTQNDGGLTASATAKQAEREDVGILENGGEGDGRSECVSEEEGVARVPVAPLSPMKTQQHESEGELVAEDEMGGGGTGEEAFSLRLSQSQTTLSCQSEDRASDERDRASSERDNGERDRAGSERDRASDERDRASSERDNGERDRASSERDNGERDRASGERDRASSERDRASSERERAGDERDKTATARPAPVYESIRLSESTPLQASPLPLSHLSQLSHISPPHPSQPSSSQRKSQLTVSSNETSQASSSSAGTPFQFQLPHNGLLRAHKHTSPPSQFTPTPHTPSPPPPLHTPSTHTHQTTSHPQQQQRNTNSDNREKCDGVTSVQSVPPRPKEGGAVGVASGGFVLGMGNVSQEEEEEKMEEGSQGEMSITIAGDSQFETSAESQHLLNMTVPLSSQIPAAVHQPSAPQGSNIPTPAPQESNGPTQTPQGSIFSNVTASKRSARSKGRPVTMATAAASSTDPFEFDSESHNSPVEFVPRQKRKEMVRSGGEGAVSSEGGVCGDVEGGESDEGNGDGGDGAGSEGVIGGDSGGVEGGEGDVVNSETCVNSGEEKEERTESKSGSVTQPSESQVSTFHSDRHVEPVTTTQTSPISIIPAPSSTSSPTTHTPTPHPHPTPQLAIIEQFSSTPQRAAPHNPPPHTMSYHTLPPHTPTPYTLPHNPTPQGTLSLYPPLAHTHQLPFTSPSSRVSHENFTAASHEYRASGTRYALRHVHMYRHIVDVRIVSQEVYDGDRLVDGLNTVWQVRERERERVWGEGERKKWGVRAVSKGGEEESE